MVGSGLNLASSPGLPRILIAATEKPGEAWGRGYRLTLYQPMTHIWVMSSHKPIIIYMGGLILGVYTVALSTCRFIICQPKNTKY